MRYRLCLLFIPLIVFSACESLSSVDEDRVSAGRQAEIRLQLEALAKDFLDCWEPPFNPGGALSLFTRAEDFHLVIDGYEINEFSEWARCVPLFMADDESFFVSYRHEIKYIESVVLSAASGVVTVVYTWDSISREGRHERSPGAITLTCREENGEWKIVHYHGSHDDPVPPAGANLPIPAR